MEKAIPVLGERLAMNRNIWVGPHGHVLIFPVEHGKTINVVAFRTKLDGKWESKDWVVPMKDKEMFEDYKGWNKELLEFLAVSQLLTPPIRNGRNLD